MKNLLAILVLAVLITLACAVGVITLNETGVIDQQLSGYFPK